MEADGSPDIARMYRRLTGRLYTADELMTVQQRLDAAYAELEVKMAAEKEQTAAKVDYGQITADALNGAFPAPAKEEQPAKPEKEK